MGRSLREQRGCHMQGLFAPKCVRFLTEQFSVIDSGGGVT